MKILGIIWGLSFCRNHGIVEGWNSGFFKGYYPFLILSFRLRRTIIPRLQYPKTHYSAKASLRAQHSNWGEAPDLRG
jgi:hypothetical protein